MNHIVYLGLGTNMGDRLANLQAALEGLPPAMEILECSQVYQTPPWGYTQQPDFLNQVIKIQTDLDPPGLLQRLKDIEASLGRRPTFRYGPRLIDLDILFFDRLVVDRPGLIIPHPRLHERNFVLVPLAELAPDFIHPVLNLRVDALLSRLDTSEIHLYQKG